MTITKDKFVAIEYTLKDDKGEQLDSSVGMEPLAYVHGRGYLIPGLEAELEGKKAGDKFNCTIQPENAYGLRDERLVVEVGKDSFETDMPIEVGMQFQAMTPAGPSIFTVIDVNGDKIKLDGNHAMAGKVLNFEITVVEVRDPTEEELAQLEGGCGCGGGCGGCGGDCSGDGSCGGCGGDCSCGN